MEGKDGCESIDMRGDIRSDKRMTDFRFLCASLSTVC